MRLIDADALTDLLLKMIYVNEGIEDRTPEANQELKTVNYLYDRVKSMPYIEPRLMKVEECANHSIEYAMGWKACVDWLKNGGDRQYFSTDEIPRNLTEEEIAKVKEMANEVSENE